MSTQFGGWTSRARGLLADALAYSQRSTMRISHVMALWSARAHLEALPVSREPFLSWSVYLADTPAKWLGTVEAGTAEEAIEIAAMKFGEEQERLMAVRRA